MTTDLVAHVLRDAPAALGSAERLMLVAIAEYAEQFGQREFEIGIAHLAERTGLTVSGARVCLRRLARHGVEVRVPLGVGKDGRTYYTFKGQHPRYRLPELVGAPACGNCASSPPAGYTCNACGMRIPAET